MIYNLPNLGVPVREKGNSLGGAQKAPNREADSGKSEPSFNEVMSKAERSTTDRNQAQAKPDAKPNAQPRTVPEADATKVAKPESKPVEIETDQPRDPAQADERFVNPKLEGSFEDQGQVERRLAILKFMDSMESELGVPPEEIAEAMANLKPADLLRPPEESALQVIENLDLNEVDQERALALYMGLLAQIEPQQQVVTPANASQVPVEGLPEAPVMGKGANLNQLQEAKPQVQTAQERKQNMNQSLERLANRFFMKEVPQEGTTELPINSGRNPVSMEGEVALNQFTSLDGDVQSFPIKGMEVAQPKAETPFFFDRETLNRMEAQKLAGLTVGATALKSYQEALDKPGALPEAAPLDSASEQANGLEASSEGLSKALENLSAKLDALSTQDSASLSTSAQDQQSSGSEAGSEGAGEGKDGSQQADSSRGDSGSFFPQMTSKTATFGAALGPSATTAADRANVATNKDALVQGAQMIATQGGGEAIVKLNPEGLGQVSMKVAIKDGTVQINMAAETPEAKKLIESSVGDLREALAQHKLSVDTIKVDVGTQLGGDRQSADRGMDFQQDQGREQARQFFNNFRDENFARREPFFESPALRNYRREPAALAPAPAASPASRYTGQGRGSKMNLVA